MGTAAERSAKVLAVARVYEIVANFSVDDVMAATRKSVPDVDYDEVALAFETLADEAADASRAVRAELASRSHSE